jgi:hypothetical protein
VIDTTLAAEDRDTARVQRQYSDNVALAIGDPVE